jgi:carbon monoxide dehydrogenase subunit G
VRLEHQFSVPAPPDVVWAAVIDPERVAPCMPGATLTEVTGAEFSGGVKVKVGPISLLYKGSGQFLETDEQARRVVIKAAGKDSRGNGTAAATVTVTLTEESGGTKGTVVTDLTVTGKPAQFGRGMIVEVGGKILDAFAECLAGKLGPSAANGAAATKPAAKAPAKSKPAPVVDEADVDDTAEEPPPQVKPKPATRRRASTKTRSTTAAPADANGEAPAAALTAELPPTQELPTEPTPAPRLQLVSDPEPEPEPEPAPKSAAAKSAKSAPSAPAASVPVAAAPAPAAPAASTPAAPAPVASETEAIDLLDYAGASVAKRLIPALVGVFLLVLLIRRLRRR